MKKEMYEELMKDPENQKLVNQYLDRIKPLNVYACEIADSLTAFVTPRYKDNGGLAFLAAATMAKEMTSRFITIVDCVQTKFEDDRSKKGKEINEYLSEVEKCIAASLGNWCVEIDKLTNDIEKEKADRPNSSRRYSLDSVHLLNPQKKISELKLSVRARNVLSAHNITTVEELGAMTKQEIAAMRNLGEKTYREIMSALDSLNVILRD